jgi:hypothetical protein
VNGRGGKRAPGRLVAPLVACACLIATAVGVVWGCSEGSAANPPAAPALAPVLCSDLDASGYKVCPCGIEATWTSIYTKVLSTDSCGTDRGRACHAADSNDNDSGAYKLVYAVPDAGAIASLVYNEFVAPGAATTGVGGTFVQVAATHHLDVTVAGVPGTQVITFAGTEKTEQAFINAINKQLQGARASDLNGAAHEITLQTDTGGPSAAGSILGTTSADVLTSLGFTVGPWTFGLYGALAANVGSLSAFQILRVTPGDPDASLLYHKVAISSDASADDTNFYGAGMPYDNRGSVCPAVVDAIGQWIQEGAPLN